MSVARATEERYLSVQNLNVQILETRKPILEGVHLEVGAGEVHVIMGPNGAGKTTLSRLLAGGGQDVFQIEGHVLWRGADLLALSPEERSWAGIFLSFQQPIGIPGVTTIQFLKTMVNQHRKSRGEEPFDPFQLLDLAKRKLGVLGLSEDLLYRGIHDGFSGGEKKRIEMLQMMLLEPRLCILDETDSGLDVDSLKAVASVINAMRSPQRAFLMITHYPRLVEHVEPDFVHILMNGRIRKTGNKSLAYEVEKNGYQLFE